MFRLRLVPADTRIPFLGMRKTAFGLSGLMILLSVVMLVVSGLNFGIDFRGGTLLEVKTPGPANLAQMRSALSGLGLGEVALQEFGAADDVLIRVERQPGDSTAQQRAVEIIKEALAVEIGAGIDYRRVEFVGPKVSGELVRDGTLALVGALVCMLIYIWFRFEWQFSIGAVAALAHDVILTFGFFAVTGLEFNLSIIAAILAIIGYSMNDTVVVYDRVRENLRKYKKLSLTDLLNQSINETLSRTTMTSITTLLALGALAIFGGAVISGFTLAMIWGVVVGTYSSVFVAAPLLMYFGVRREMSGDSAAGAGDPASSP